jgi:hypothetical protein
VIQTQWVYWCDCREIPATSFLTTCNWCCWMNLKCNFTNNTTCRQLQHIWNVLQPVSYWGLRYLSGWWRVYQPICRIEHSLIAPVFTKNAAMGDLNSHHPSHFSYSFMTNLQLHTYIYISIHAYRQSSLAWWKIVSSEISTDVKPWRNSSRSR